jgi:hypothetical protein
VFTARNAQNQPATDVLAQEEPGATFVHLADGTTVEIAAGATAVIGPDGTVRLAPAKDGESMRRSRRWLTVLGRDVRAALVATAVIEVLRGLGVSS